MSVLTSGTHCGSEENLTKLKFSTFNLLSSISFIFTELLKEGETQTSVQVSPENHKS